MDNGNQCEVKLFNPRHQFLPDLGNAHSYGKVKVRVFTMGLQRVITADNRCAFLGKKFRNAGIRVIVDEAKQRQVCGCKDDFGKNCSMSTSANEDHLLSHETKISR